MTCSGVPTVSHHPARLQILPGHVHGILTSRESHCRFTGSVEGFESRYVLVANNIEAFFAPRPVSPVDYGSGMTSRVDLPVEVEVFEKVGTHGISFKISQFLRGIVPLRQIGIRRCDWLVKARPLSVPKAFADVGVQ